MEGVPAWPNLFEGKTGENVSALQCLLNHNSSVKIAVDGIFGSEVRKTLIKFQCAAALVPDGIAGKNTLSKLVETTEKNVDNHVVMAVQYLLSKFETVEIDGDFGEKTLAALQAFQSKMKLSKTTAIERITWNFLFAYDTYPDISNIEKYKNYIGDSIFTESQLVLLEYNIPFYKKSAEISGVPWQMLAAIHYREYSLRRGGPSNGDGPYQIWGKDYPIGVYSDDQFQLATNEAAMFLRNKIGSKDISNIDTIKYAFFAYNGTATAYKKQAKLMGCTDHQANIGEGSPYVMNRYDARRDPTREPVKTGGTWGQIKVDHGAISYPATNNFGAFVVYIALL